MAEAEGAHMVAMMTARPMAAAVVVVVAEEAEPDERGEFLLNFVLGWSVCPCLICGE